MKKIILLLVFILVKLIGFNQEYKFNYYGQEQGLTDLFVYTINQAEDGYLMVGTSQGVGFYDGNTFDMKTVEDNLANNQISTSYKDSKGNIWYGHNQGGVTKYKDNKFEIIHTGEGINSMINGIQEDSKGNIWFSTQLFGVFVLNEDNKITFFNEKFSERMISTLFIDEDDNIFIGADDKTEVYKYVEENNTKLLSKTQNIKGIDDYISKIILIESGEMLVATKTMGLYIIEKKESVFVVTPVKMSNLEESLLIKDIYISSGRLWISTYGSGVLRTILTNNSCFVSEIYTNQNGLKGENNIEVTFIDREGVLWLGTTGDGLFSKENNMFTFYFRNQSKEYEVNYLDVGERTIWVANDNQLDCYDKQYGKLKTTYSNKNYNLPNDKITCFDFADDTVLLIGYKNQGFYYRHIKDSIFSKLELSEDHLSQRITSIDVCPKYIWIGTQNGVFSLNRANREITRYSMKDGLSHNSVLNLYVNKDNKVYVGTKSAYLTVIEDDSLYTKSYQIEGEEDYASISVSKIVEGVGDNIWISSLGQGVFCFSGSIIKHYDTRGGLYNNYCYGLALDDKGKIWVSHDGGLSSIDLATDKIEVYDSKYGLNTRFIMSAIDFLDNEVWIGTQNGVVKYNSKEDVKNNVPPITSLRKVIIDDENLDKIVKDTILPFGEHDLDFYYRGISLKNTEGLKYKFILEGYDDDWSEFTKNNVIKYNKVRDGNYTFKVKSYNNDGVEGNMSSISIKIGLPFYKKWWVYLILLILIIIIITIIIKYRERQHINYLNKLSEELDLRTSELVEQKEKTEEINKDLTDSINYAQRIQTAILPEDNFVKELFPESFILFKPRDIVSGDFYWIAEYFGKKIVVSADCTGHGVPGGFMSMIGRILLRETCTVKNLRDPGVILEEIDKGLVNVLKQTDDIESNKDGMDVGICVIDSRTNMLSYAGAMRPLYIYRDGKRTEIKGSRFSIGGVSKRKKIFESNNYQLEKGDSIYMFSDGFPDQFGGSRGRKMKISVLKELLDQVSQMPFGKQKEEINTFFENWKRDTPQMDDVLMIGIKI